MSSVHFLDLTPNRSEKVEEMSQARGSATGDNPSETSDIPESLASFLPLLLIP